MQFEVISPIDNTVLTTLDYTDDDQLLRQLVLAKKAQRHWVNTSLAQRQQCCRRFVDAMVANKSEIGLAICQQMGRPLAQAENEVSGLKERADYLIDTATDALADSQISHSAGEQCFIRKQALGIVLVIAPWNYPLLTAVNVIVPAILAGNAVLLKHSSQTPLCAMHFSQAFEQAGLPADLFQSVFLTHQQTGKLLQSDHIDFVSFTGSVAGGHQIQSHLSKRFINATLELGGKDAAYVCHDADLAYAASELCDGVFYNAGQSCCGIERIYVDKGVYEEFVARLVANTYELTLGNPLSSGVTMGPMATEKSADAIRAQVQQAKHQGARLLIDEARFPHSHEGRAYCSPQILVNVEQSMNLMQHENFGPIVGIMAVDNDEQALNYINDSQYGLTASIWTSDMERAKTLGQYAEVGTWYMNRCDYLHPALAWGGVKDSGKGVSLSRFGFDSVTRLQSFNLRVRP